VHSVEKRGFEVRVRSSRFVGIRAAKAWQATTRHANGSLGTLGILQGSDELLPANATSICRAAATL